MGNSNKMAIFSHSRNSKIEVNFQIFFSGNSGVILRKVQFFITSIFLAIFRNEILTILTPSTLEGGGGVGGGHVFRFEGP